MGNDTAKLSIILSARDEASSTIKSFGESLQSVGEIAAGLGLERLTEKIVELGEEFTKAGFEAASALEVMRVNFDNAFGNADLAGGLLKQLEELSYQTPFTSEQLDKFALRMKNAGESTDRIIPFIKSLSNVAAGTGATFQDMSSIVETAIDSYSNAVERGGVSSIQLRSFASQGIPIYEALAEVLNKSAGSAIYTKDSLAHASKDIKITADNLQDALTLLGSTKYADQALREASTFDGAMKNLKAVFTDTVMNILGVNDKGEIQAGGVFDTLRNAASTTLQFFQDHKDEIISKVQAVFTGIKEAADKVQPILQWLIDHKDVVESVFIGIGIAVLIGMVPAIWGAVVAFGALFIAALPWIALAALIAAGVYVVIFHWDDLKSHTEMIFEALGITLSAFGTQIHTTFVSIVDGAIRMVNGMIDTIDGLIKGINSIGAKINVPAIPTIGHIAPMAFDQGGWVPDTGLAILHKGEFVLSKDMIAGRQASPIVNNSNVRNQPITIYATINQEVDLNLLGQQIAFAVGNSR